MYLSNNNPVTDPEYTLVKEKIKTEYRFFKDNLQMIMNATYDQNLTSHQDIIKKHSNLKNAKDNFVKFLTKEFFTTNANKLEKIYFFRHTILEEVEKKKSRHTTN